MKRVPNRHSKAPGERIVIQVDLADSSLPLLKEGLTGVERVWLEDNGDGTFTLCATQTLGEMRKQPGKPASDLLVEMLNDFADVLEGDDVPVRVAEAWDKLVEDWMNRTAPESRPDASCLS